MSDATLQDLLEQTRYALQIEGYQRYLAEAQCAAMREELDKRCDHCRERAQVTPGFASDAGNKLLCRLQKLETQIDEIQEDCAQICDERARISDNRAKDIKGGRALLLGDDRTNALCQLDARSDEAEDCAAAIRAMEEP